VCQHLDSGFLFLGGLACTTRIWVSPRFVSSGSLARIGRGVSGPISVIRIDPTSPVFHFRSTARRKIKTMRNATANVTDGDHKHIESYDYNELRSTKGQNPLEQTFFCEYCMRTCIQNARGTKHYCSNACKTAASRARNHTKSTDHSDGRSPAEKAIDTKSEQLRSKECDQCGMYFDINGFQSKRRFCSNKCKTAYHRRYQKSYAEWRAKRTFDAPKPIALTDDEKIYLAWSGALDQDTEITHQEGSNSNESN